MVREPSVLCQDLPDQTARNLLPVMKAEMEDRSTVCLQRTVRSSLARNSVPQGFCFENAPQLRPSDRRILVPDPSRDGLREGPRSCYRLAPVDLREIKTRHRAMPLPRPPCQGPSHGIGGARTAAICPLSMLLQTPYHGQMDDDLFAAREVDLVLDELVLGLRFELARKFRHARIGIARGVVGNVVGREELYLLSATACNDGGQSDSWRRARSALALEVPTLTARVPAARVDVSRLECEPRANRDLSRDLTTFAVLVLDNDRDG